MSYTRTTDMEAKRKGRFVDTFDHINIGDFFDRPSAHELSTASERRVQEIMSALDRQTAEELASWSHTSPTRWLSKFGRHETPEHTAQPDVVSSPLSLPSRPLSPVLALDTDSPAAISDSYNKSRSRLSCPTGDPAPSTSSQSKLVRTATGLSRTKRAVSEEQDYIVLDRSSSTSTATKSPAKFPMFASKDSKLSARKTQSVPALAYGTSLHPPPVSHSHQVSRDHQHHGTTAAVTKTFLTVLSNDEIGASSELNSIDNKVSVGITRNQAQVIPTIIVTSPIADQSLTDHNVKASSQSSSVKRKALPMDSPLLVLLGSHPVMH